MGENASAQLCIFTISQFLLLFFFFFLLNLIVPSLSLKLSTKGKCYQGTKCSINTTKILILQDPYRYVMV